ncbi:SwmB domain-containing protein [uncultured Massilia sp.]|uniref:SwmB domain-containing protein n=1 Tax=uncultured Massilia sp. TaxID=169973 RepID=UPI0025E434F2|nr:SwmB domain-containing protein [uncultured Massilia sp.]
MSVSNSAASLDSAVAKNEIVFIDSSLPDFAQLVAAVKAGTDVVLLDASQDGLQQIAQVLAGRSGVDAIHVLSHGSAGALDLGNAHVTLDNLSAYGDALGTIRAALAADADVLLYGCDVAQGAQGQSFIAALAAATGADVAASTDLTGSALLGGDWTLEAAVGHVQTAALGSDGALAAYAGTLGMPATGTTIDFNTPDYTDMGATVTDGEFGSDDVAGLVIQMYRGDMNGQPTGYHLSYIDSGSNGGVYGNYKTYTSNPNNTDPDLDPDGGDGSFVIKERDGKEFGFTQILLGDYGAEAATEARISGYRDGQLVGYVDVPFGLVTSADLPSNVFGNVDEVRVSAVDTTRANGHLWLFYDRITIATSGTPPSDTTKPTVASIEYVTSATGVTNADELVYKVTFSETVQNVDATDFTVTGPTGSSLAVTPVDGSTYTVKVSGGNLAGYNGAVTLGFAGNQDIADSASNTLDLTNPPAINQITYTLDNNAPTVASIVRNAAAATNADSLTWTVTFSESVDNLDASDFSVSGTTATVTNVTGSGTTYQVTVSGGDLDYLDGNVTLGFAGGQDIADGAGNALVATTPTGTNQPGYALDNTAPTFVSAAVNGDQLVLTYSEALDTQSVPSFLDFMVNVGNSSVGVSSVVVDGTKVTLTLGAAVLPGQSVAVAYNDPNSGGVGAPIQDAVGNDAQVLLPTAVTNNTPASNHAPTIADYISTSVRTGTASALPDYKVADVDGDNLTVTLTATNGTIDGLVDADGNPANGIQLQGSAAVINAALADATFTATNNGTASVSISVTDGKVGSPVTATSYLAATSPEPSISGGAVAGTQQQTSDRTSVVTGADGNLYMAMSGSDTTLSVFKWNGVAWSVAATLDVAADMVDSYTKMGAAVPIAVDQYGKIHALVSLSHGMGSNVNIEMLTYDGGQWTSALLETLEATSPNASIYNLTGASVVVTSDNVVNVSYHRAAGAGYNVVFQEQNFFATNATGSFVAVGTDGVAGSKTLQQVAGLDKHSFLIQAAADGNSLIVKDLLPGQAAVSSSLPTGDDLVGAAVDAGGALMVVTVDGGNAMHLWQFNGSTWTSTPVPAPQDGSHWYAPYDTVDTSFATGRPGLVRGLDGKIYLAVQEVDAANGFYGNKILTLENGGWIDGKADIDEFNDMLSPTFAVDASGNLMLVDGDASMDLPYVFGHDTDFQGLPPSDTTAPSFLFAAIDGGALTLSYDEALDAAHLPPANAFAVKVDNAAVVVTDVAIGADGKSVVLTLATPALAGQAVTVAYTDPSGSNDANAIQDVAGNDAATLPVNGVGDLTPPFQGVGALFTFDTAAGAGAGTLAGVDMTTHHATYDHNASQVRLNIVTADSKAEDFAYFMNGDTSSLASRNGLYVGYWEPETSVQYSLSDFGADSGNYTFDLKSLRLYHDQPGSQTFRIMASNGQFQDIVLDAAAPNSYLTAAYALDPAKFSGIASFTITSLTDTDSGTAGNQSVYIIDNIVMDNIVAIDTTAPTLQSAIVVGTSLVLTYDEALDAVNAPDVSAFTVKVGGQAVSVTNVMINPQNGTVTLTLANAVQPNQVVTVSYADNPNGTGPLQDAAGNDAAPLNNQTVSNNSGDTLAPTLTSATVTGTSLVLTYSEALDVHAPTAGAFTVDVGGTPVAVTNVALDANTGKVTLTLASAVQPGQAVTVSYAPVNGQDPIQDTAGNDAAPLANHAVTNNTLDTVAPTLQSAIVVGTSLVLTYDEALDAASAPDVSAFTVKVGGQAVSVTNMVINAQNGTVTLTLADAVQPNQIVTVSYADNPNGVGPLQDAAGNDAVPLTDEAVTNNSLDTLAPTLASAAVNGTSLVLTYNEALDINQQLSAGAFTVKVGNATVAVTGAVVNNDKTVTLTLATAVQPDDVVKVSYQVPSTGGVVQDAAGNDAAAVTDATVTNNSGDTLAPTLASAAVNGTSLVLTYNEALDISQQLSAGAFTVKVGNATVAVTGAVVNSDKTVTLTLATAVQPNDVVKVSYQVPSTGGVVQDAAGNDAAAVTDAAVTNNSGDTLAPTLQAATAVGTSLVLTYNEALDTQNAPLKGDFVVKVDGQPVTVDSLSIDPVTHSVKLVLASAVQPNQAVTVSYADSTSGVNTIQDGAGNDAAPLANQVVTNNSLDTLAPTLASAAVNGTSLVLTYNEALDISQQLAGGAFTVKVGNATVAVTGAVVNNDKTVTLTLATAVQPNDVVKVSYQVPSTGGVVQDAAGNDAAPVTDATVTNNSGDTLAPTLASAAVNGTSLVLTYNEALDISQQLTAGAFTVKVGNATVAVTGAVVNNDKTVTLTLATAVQPNDVVKVSYQVPSSGGVVQDAAGNDAAAVTDATVTNNSGDTLAPTFVSAAVNGRTLVMTYDEALDAAHAPAASAFAVHVGNATVAVSAVVVDAVNKTVTLTLASSVQNGQSVTVSYTDPTNGNDANAIQDAAGNDAASVANRPVANNTPVVVTPPVTPPPTETTVDGVKVVSEQVTNPDGSTSTKLTIPTVTASRDEQVGNNTLADIPLAQNASGGNILLAQLPVGFGMTTSGSGIKLASDSLTDLIREIKAHTAAGSADQNQLTGGGTGFLGDLASSTNLLVQTIVPTANINTAPSQPLAITGIPSAPGNPFTAIVLDASGLPAGTQIKLDNVEFAALIGAVNVSGGAGSQKVWGDGASQTIFLGEGDDTLHGGGGDDIVGSAGGNDHVYGDDGDDIVFGGEGDDYVDGGSGHDIARYSGAGRDGYSLRVKDGHLVIKDLHGTDGTDTVVDVEVLRFTGAAADTTARGTVARLIEAASGAKATDAAIDLWIDALGKGAHQDDVARGLLSANGLDKLGNAEFIDALYHNVLGRDADAGGKAAWVAALDSGKVDKAGAALMIADSAEKIAMGQSVDLDFNHSDVATLVRMYETLFARHADEGGLNFWIGLHESGASLTQVADWFVGSNEATAQYGGLTDAQFVDALYHSAFDRAGSAAEQKFWLDGLASGQLDRGDVLLGFADSQEMLTLVGAINTSIPTV